MKIRYSFIIQILALFLLQPELPGQTPFLKHHNLVKGRRDYKTTAIFQDARGYIWFGTTIGLIKYDGIDYQTFTVEQGLSDNHVTAIIQDLSEVIWIGHDNGSISLYDGYDFKPFTPEEGLGKIPITDIVVDLWGNVWYSTLGEGVYYYNGRRVYNIDMDDGLADNYVYCLEIGADSAIWMGTDYGISVYSLNDKLFRHYSMKDGLPDNIVKDIKRTDDQNYLIATDEKGLVNFRPEDNRFETYKYWKFGSINNIVPSGRDIWISTSRNGVIQLSFSIDGSYMYNSVNNTHGLLSDRTVVLFIDRENNIWIGSNNGVTQAITPIFEFLDERHGLPFSIVYSFLEDENEFYWICSDKGLFRATPSLSDGYIIERFFQTGPFSDVHFISLFEDTDHYIWAGSYDFGVFRINPATHEFVRFSDKDGLADNNVISISGQGNRIYLSTLGGGLSVCDIISGKITFSTYNQDNYLSSNYVYSTFIDHSNRLWVAEANSSISRIEYSTVSRFSEKDSLFASSFYYFTEDSSHNIWLSTDDNGIYCFDGERFINFNESDGLRSSDIKSLLIDKYQNLILVSNEGIDLLQTGDGHVSHFGENYGVAYKEPLLNSIYRDRDDNIWIGTSKGLIKYNPARLFCDSIRPLVFISGKRLLYENITYDRRIFRHKENHFTFDYTGLWYQDPEQLVYRYQLEGYDLSWSIPTRTRTITYSRIPPGSYTFRVEVSLDNTVWIGGDEAQYSFTIKPPFWQRWWFILLSIITALLGIYGIFRARLAALQRAKVRLEEEVRRATKEILEKNEELEAQKNEIEAQRDLVMEQRDQIANQQQELQASIRYAYRIQTAVLTPQNEMSRLIKDYFILNIPRDIVSGDFYWVAEKSDYIFFAVADSTGHGVPGAFMSMLGVSAFNEVLSTTECGFHANIFLFHLREHVQKALHHSDTEQQTPDGMDAALCIYDRTRNLLSFAGANNPVYHISNNNLTEYKADKMPIGIHFRDKDPFTEYIFAVQPGDMVYLFSDGLADQFGGPEGKKFKYLTFKQRLLEINRLSTHEQMDELRNTITGWMGKMDQVDDIMVMGIRF